MSGTEIVAIIESGCKFDGDLSLSGPARIAGSVKGKIFSDDSIIISDGALVQADITARIIIISGFVKGNISATGRVEIRRPARFEGSINTPSLIVEDGVIFHGTTSMKEQI
jgi:cytoskeletal protein CcmA (bactofilin family)